ncbi:unnamed protein product, partial [Iphiclides podalirius]
MVIRQGGFSGAGRREVWDSGVQGERKRSDWLIERRPEAARAPRGQSRAQLQLNGPTWIGTVECITEGLSKDVCRRLYSARPRHESCKEFIGEAGAGIGSVPHVALVSPARTRSPPFGESPFSVVSVR